MKKTFGLFVLIIALGAPAGAQMMSGQSAMGMGPMQYYVGSWSCMAGPVGKPQSKATATYTLDSGVLRGWVLVPPQGKMKSAYALEIVTTYDAKNHRFVQIQLGNDSNWSVDYAKLGPEIPSSGSITQTPCRPSVTAKRSARVRTVLTLSVIPR